MHLTNQALHQLADPNLSLDERALVRCDLAKRHEDSGNYEVAREAMGEFWRGVGEPPVLEGLDARVRAAVLLRVGALTGHIGSAKQIEGAQEAAKDLIGSAGEIFSNLHLDEGIANFQIELALCYWREGAFDEARIILQEALVKLTGANNDLKALALLRSAIVEGSANRLNDALRIYIDAAPLFDLSDNLALKGKFHHGFGFVLKKIAEAEQRPSYLDQALIEYAAASFYFEQSGLSRYQACVENNLAFVFCVLGRFDEAHEHLDRAQTLLTRLKDNVHLAQVDETRARVMLAEGRVIEAEKTVRAAVRILEQGDEQSLLAEALTTHGIAQARLQHPDQAKLTLERA